MFLLWVAMNASKARWCWRKDLAEFRGLTDRERAGFLLVLEWFERCARAKGIRIGSRCCRRVCWVRSLGRSSGRGRFGGKIGKRAWPESTCRVPWRGSSAGQRRPSSGFGYFQHARFPVIRLRGATPGQVLSPGSGDAIISTGRSITRRSSARPRRQGSRSG